MAYYYAQLNGAGICMSITQNGAPLVGPQYVQLDSFRADLLGMKWTGSAWVAP